MGIKHRSTGLGLKITETIWAEEHEIKDVIPESDATYNLGSSSKRFANLYAVTVNADNILGEKSITYEKCMFFDVDGKIYEGSFGKSTKGGTEVDLSNNYIYGSKFTLSDSITAETITVYVKYIAEAKLKCGIYRVSDGALMCETDFWTITSGYDDWKTLSFTTTPTLAAGDYFLVWLLRTQHAYFYYDTVSGVGISKFNDSDSFPDPLEDYSTTDRQYSIYVNVPDTYYEIAATRVKVANNYIQPQYARIIARASGDQTGTKKLKIYDGNTDVAEVTWSGSGVQDVASDWVEYTDTSDRTMSVYFQKSTAIEKFTLYNVTLEMRR